MKPPKALAWPALALCLAPVAAHAALIPAHLYRPARNMTHVVRPSPLHRQLEDLGTTIMHLTGSKV